MRSTPRPGDRSHRSKQQHNPSKTPVEPQPRHLCFRGGGRPKPCRTLWLDSCGATARGEKADDRQRETRKGEFMLRRAAVIAASLAVATSFGLAGAGVASAAAPALKIKNGAIWTIEVNGGGCQQDKFNTTSPPFQGGECSFWRRQRHLDRWRVGQRCHDMDARVRCRRALQRRLPGRIVAEGV